MTDVIFVPQRWDEAEEGEPGYWGVKRDWHEDLFAEMLETIGCNVYGYVEDEALKLNQFEVAYKDNDPMKHYCIDTPLFTLRPFYWEDNDEVYALPNFVYKPFDLEINWYKWPMRDATTNCKLTDNEWRFMCQNVMDWCAKNEAGQTPLVPQHSSKLTDADLIAIKLRKQMHDLVANHDHQYDIIYRFLRYVSNFNDGSEPTIYEVFDELKEEIGWDEEFDGRLNITSFSQASDADKNAIAQITFDISPIDEDDNEPD